MCVHSTSSVFLLQLGFSFSTCPAYFFYDYLYRIQRLQDEFSWLEHGAHNTRVVGLIPYRPFISDLVGPLQLKILCDSSFSCSL